MIEASTNDRHANSLQTWQCPNCKAHETLPNDKKISKSRFRTFASSSNLQIEEAYRRMQLKRPIESIYDHPPLITAARINKKPRGAHIRVKTAAKDTQELKYVATRTSSNSGPPLTDLQPEIYKTSTRSMGDKNKPLSAECPEVVTTNCRQSRTELLPLNAPYRATNKSEIKPISDPPSMNVATNVHSQLENVNIHVQELTLTNSHEAQHPAMEGNTDQTLNQDKDKDQEQPLPPLLDLRKYLKRKILPKHRNNTLRPTFSDLGAPPAKRRRLVYHATAPDVHMGVEGPKNDDATPLFADANNNNDLNPLPSSSLGQRPKARDNPIVTSSDKNTAQETSISALHTPFKQQQPVVESVGSSHPTHTITTQPLHIRTPSPTPTCLLAVLPSPAITPTVLPSSPIELSKDDSLQDNPKLYVQSDSTERGCASLGNDIAESSNGNPSTTNSLLSSSHMLPSSNNSAINQGCLMENNVTLKCSSDVSEVDNEPECAMPDLTESTPDRHSKAANSIPEADQGSEVVAEVEALDTPIPIPSTAGCEVERKDTHVEPSFADGLFSPPPTDDETQFVNLGPPSVTKPNIGDIPNGLDKHTSHAANIRHVTEVTPVEKTELLSSLDNILKRLPQPPPSFRLSTVTVPGLAKCFRPFGLSTKRAY
ncbi:hypothetical protein Clacol_003433 [Clathrus columnatus]|uniref:Uncharacterized protein n=1 Tax=Clathrus columnatus TaxID=1419009 RepID=A0AAV5A3H4_9AGAM|nr:hypothetical protein Clacol_003433 [Clathrus columnatus]